MTRSTKLDSLRAQAAATAKPAKTSYQDDGTSWKPTRDAAGKSSNIIRFLPAANGEAFPFITFFQHAFQGPSGQWLIFHCPSTISTGGYPSDHCPVCAHVHSLYQTGQEADKVTARGFNRKKHWTANVLVVSDTAVPTNNGGIFKYKFGSTIFDKLNDCLNPEDGSEPLDPFDLIEGANFSLSIAKVGGYPNYDKSKFAKPTRFCADSAIEALLVKAHPLAPLVDAQLFKSYADIEQRFNRVMGFAQNATTPAPTPSRKSTTSELPPLEHDDDFFANLAARS
jgi:hypothetical protein